MGPGHGEDVGGAFNQAGREWLTAKMTDVDTFIFANLHGIQTWGLSAYRMHSGRGDFDIFSVPNQPPKKTFRDGTSANVSGTDKKDAFHDAGRASYACAT
jgi:hypothetical protein